MDCIRRIDDLGRVVIPKKIIRDLNIQECDPLKIIRDGKNIILCRVENEEVQKNEGIG